MQYYWDFYHYIPSQMQTLLTDGFLTVSGDIQKNWSIHSKFNGRSQDVTKQYTRYKLKNTG